MNRLKCQRQKKSFVSIGMIGTFRYLGLDPSICLAKDFRISTKIYENCIQNDIPQGMRHAARQLVTAGVRMLPCFPGVGDGADYGTFGPQTTGIGFGIIVFSRNDTASFAGSST